MHFVCRTCSAVQSVVPERDSACLGCGARLLSHEAEHAWYTLGAAGQEGPFDAAQLAGMFDRADLAWTDNVWRIGLRSWRPARKDDVLVVAVANARGLDTATTRLDALSNLLQSPPERRFEDSGDDTVIDVLPAGLTGSWRAVPALPARRSRSQAVARLLKLATLALAAFVGGGLIVGLVGRLSGPSRPHQVEAAPLSVASMVSTAPLTPVRPNSGERVKRTLPALDEVRAELLRLAPSVRLCAREPKLGLELELTIAGDTGRPRRIEVRTPRLTPGMIECAVSALQELRVAPFTAAELAYSHHYAW
jgi:hypothetical protein